MKLFHISDLHLGKRLFEYSLIEDQAFILNRITELAADERPDALIIAGDIYDKPVPSAEAVTLFDSFLCSIQTLGVKTMIISGNHDSPERIAFGGELMRDSGVYVSPVFDGTCSTVTLHDSYGEVRFYLLPFIKPAHVRHCFPDAQIESYTDAVRAVVDSLKIDTSVRNVMITHQFITGASRSDSEEISVGGSDNVDAAVLSAFDYVALGHIHAPQTVGSERIRYCGTPLKYSFSEVSHTKSITVAELCEKGSVTVTELPLQPLRELRELRGTYDNLTLRDSYKDTAVEDYLHITLTDEDDIPDAVSKLRVIYPNLMKLDYDNARTKASGEFKLTDTHATLSPIELFGELYEKQNGAPMDAGQTEYMKALIEKIAEGEI